MPADYRCVSDHAEDLTSGRLLAPGESVVLSDEEIADPHNARLITEGKLIPCAAVGDPPLATDGQVAVTDTPSESVV